jgi:16S rRNA (cytidine1402-2'-O)-methyltransferase
VRRGSLASLALWAVGEVRGEITVVVGGAPPRPVDMSEQLLAGLVSGLEIATGMSRKEAIADVAKQRGLPKRVVFEAVVRAKQPRDTSGN